MRWRTLITSAAAAVMVFVPTVSASAGDQQLPLHFGGSTPYVWVAPPAGCPGFGSYSEAVLPTPHLGQATWKEMDCGIPTSPTSGIYFGTGTITAANGDVLNYQVVHGVYFPNPDRPGTLRTTVTNVFTGGTGRFESATGSIDFVGVIVPTGPGVGYIEGEFEGWISYNASDRPHPTLSHASANAGTVSAIAPRVRARTQRPDLWTTRLLRVLITFLTGEGRYPPFP